MTLKNNFPTITSVPVSFLCRVVNHISVCLSRSWARGKLLQLDTLLPSSGSVIDIGSGTGVVAEMLRVRGFRVTSIDVRDRSLPGTEKPVLYNGQTIPFNDNSFDCALLLTVLHHTANPTAVLREAARVAEQILVIEDVYRNPVQKYLTFFTDSLFNFEFRGHPHSNKTDPEWRKIYSSIGLRVTDSIERRVLFFYRQHAYRLIKIDDHR